MSRRRDRVRNRRRKRRPDRWLIILQIALLVGGLAFLYAFGDEIAAGAGNLVSQLTHEGAAPEAADASGGGSSGARLAPPLETPPRSGPADAGEVAVSPEADATD